MIKQSTAPRASERNLQSSVTNPPLSAPRLLFSVLLLLAAVWSIQVMSSTLLRARGDHLRLAGEYSSAENLYKIAMKIDSKNWAAYLGLGQVYSYYRYYELNPTKKNEWAQQERDTFAQAYQQNIKKEEIMYGLGRAELALGNREAGIDFLRKAAQYKRFNDYYWRKLGIELRKAGFYNEAMETFLYARKLDRSNPTVKYNIQWLKKTGIVEPR